MNSLKRLLVYLEGQGHGQTFSFEDGGLKMLDLESMISAQRIMCVKKYVENYESPWKYVLDFYLKKVGGKFLFQCNFDHRTLSITLPIFYRECLQAWSSQYD